MKKSLSKFTKTSFLYAINLMGRSIQEKYLVIESDDWGCIRMPSPEVRKKLINFGAVSPKNHYARFDTIASDTDWNALLESLSQFRDVNGNYPVFTANFIMSNPDFEKIAENNYQSYYYESFLETTKKYTKSINYESYLHHAIENKMFRPQFHGREHLNVEKWLIALQRAYSPYLKAFEYNCYFVEPNSAYFNGKDIFAALDFEDKSSWESHIQMLKEGLVLFKNYFGYDSQTYIAPNYIWSSAHEKFLFDLEVLALQGTKFRNDPTITSGVSNYRRKLRLMGHGGVNTPINLVRNCFFEPSSGTGAAAIQSCLRGIGIAFKCKQPAVISSHRLNFLGEHHPENRFDNLHYLKTLIQEVLKKWPDVQFISSDELLKKYQQKNFSYGS